LEKILPTPMVDITAQHNSCKFRLNFGADFLK